MLKSHYLQNALNYTARNRSTDKYLISFWIEIQGIKAEGTFCSH